MNDNEVPRLIEWLTEHEHTDTEIVECVYFVTKGQGRNKPTDNE